MPTIINGNTGVNKVTSASVVPYDNSSSGLPATNVQELGDGSGIQLGTSVTLTNQASVDFAIPAGAKRVTVMFAGVSTNGAQGIALQLGVSGTPETSGYESNAFGVTNSGIVGTAGTNITTGLVTASVHAANSLKSGTVELNTKGGNYWVCNSALIDSATPLLNFGVGTKQLSGVLDIVRVSASGDNFDAGTINVSWEF